MDEQEKKEQELTPAEIEDETPAEEAPGEELVPAENDEAEEAAPETEEKPKPKNSGFRKVMWVVCALYLFYLAYQLIHGLVTGEAEKTNSVAVCIIGSIVFIGAGLFLLIRTIVNSVREFKEQIAEMNAQDAAEQEQATLEAAGEEDVSEEDENAPDDGEK